MAVMRVWSMRPGISSTVSPVDRARLEAVVADRNSPQSHAWRCRIVLLTADGQGTNAIMREAGVWQDRGLALPGTLRRRWRRRPAARQDAPVPHSAPGRDGGRGRGRPHARRSAGRDDPLDRRHGHGFSTPRMLSSQIGECAIAYGPSS